MTEELKVSKKDFWEEKYSSGNMPWDINQVAPAFVKYLDKEIDISGRQVAVLGCGCGHDAFYFAEKGFKVFGFDFSESAIQLCNKFKETNNITNTNFFQADFFDLIKEEKWENHFDYVLEHTSLCAIDPKRRDEYIHLIKYLLKPGGRLIGLFFIKPKELGGPPYGCNIEEVRELFSKGFTEAHELHPESCLHTNLTGEEYFGIFQKQ